MATLEGNPLVEVAMHIILAAGDARVAAGEAFAAAKKFDFEGARAKIEVANVKILEAHRAQTDVIQAEMGGQRHDLLLIFVHAQDTLMTIKTEVRLVAEMIDMFEILLNGRCSNG